MSGAINMNGRVITNAGITGGNLNATLLNSNTLSELFSNATKGGNSYQLGTIGFTDLLNKSSDAYDNDDSDADFLNLTGGTMTGAINMNGKVITNAGITGGNLNGTNLNGNNINELFTNATATIGARTHSNTDISELANLTKKQTFTLMNTFSDSVNVGGSLNLPFDPNRGGTLPRIVYGNTRLG
jgi:hypothetical protein